MGTDRIIFGNAETTFPPLTHAHTKIHTHVYALGEIRTHDPIPWPNIMS